MLDDLAYTAIPTESGAEALRLIASKPEIDLVLADFAMREMNGVDLARAISNARPALPVILVTGYSELDALNKIGERRILQKPYTDSELVRKITLALN
jgi:CheY-like chemotaxis protein